MAAAVHDEAPIIVLLATFGPPGTSARHDETGATVHRPRPPNFVSFRSKQRTRGKLDAMSGLLLDTKLAVRGLRRKPWAVASVPPSTSPLTPPYPKLFDVYHRAAAMSPDAQPNKYSLPFPWQVCSFVASLYYRWFN